MNFASDPRKVNLDGEFRSVLQRLYVATGGAIALISGRAIADIDRIFPDTKLPVAGQHGFELRQEQRNTPDDAIAARFAQAGERIAGVSSRHRGLLLELKGHSLALHYRRAPRLGGFAHKLIRSLLLELGPGYDIQAGKRVVEIRPVGRDKGAAISDFMMKRPFRGRIPVFIGDDLTDEPGFSTVNALGGHSIKVGSGPTCARFRLSSVAAVRKWLKSRPGENGGL